jgi:hypothetical protein
LRADRSAIEGLTDRWRTPARPEAKEYDGIDEHTKLAHLLDGRLAKMLSLFRQFDAEIKVTVERLAAEITKAERVAADINPRFRNMPTLTEK